MPERFTDTLTYVLSVALAAGVIAFASYKVIKLNGMENPPANLGLNFPAPKRKIIIDECTAEHVNLLETLIGKLTHRLMQLPGVLGVRVKIAKLEIFEDCEVAIRMETGQW